MGKKNINKKIKSSQSIKIGQFLYLSFNLFNRNVLWESASSCSYGFICSFIPIVFLIISILLGVVRVSPGILSYIAELAHEIAPMIDIKKMVDAVLIKHSFSVMDVLLGLWIIWMARKLTISIIRGLGRIFRSEIQRKNWWIQILTFISEFVLVLLIAVFIFTTFVLRKFISQPVFEDLRLKFPILNRYSSKVIATAITYFIIFICTLFAYKYLSGIYPSFKKSFICALSNTLTFLLVVKLFDALINRANYTFLYGTISSIIILIIKVYFFFVLFLLFAQMIYVSECFDKLLKSQIYFLPKDEDLNLAQSFIRMLFINPSILQNEENTIHIHPGSPVYSEGEKVTCVYYLHKGIIAETSKDGIIKYLQPGSLLGETLCILNSNYETTATALTECELVSFSSEEFMQILQKDSKIAINAVTKVNEYTTPVKS